MSATMHSRIEVKSPDGSNTYSVNTSVDEDGAKVVIRDGDSLRTLAVLALDPLTATVWSQALNLAGTMVAVEDVKGGDDKGPFGNIGKG